MSDFRRKIVTSAINGGGGSIFDDAYFYVPFKDGQTVVDVNHGISPTVNTGSLTSDGYYTTGDNQLLIYTNSELLKIFETTNWTIFLDLIPYSMGRNEAVFRISISSGSGHTTPLSLFIYYSKNNKFGLTLDTGGMYDDEIPNSPTVIYQNRYKISIKWDSNYCYVFINGEKYSVSKQYNLLFPLYSLALGGNPYRTDRYAKATYDTFAVWNRVLTDEECINLTK